MKINQKIDPETLFILHKILLAQCQGLAHGIAAKSFKSMKVELFSILTQKCVSYTSNATGKKLGLSLKYHLAALLYEILIEKKYSPLGVYEANKIEMLKNELHQKLQ
jgi:hypothetical protein